MKVTNRDIKDSMLLVLGFNADPWRVAMINVNWITLRSTVTGRMYYFVNDETFQAETYDGGKVMKREEWEQMGVWGYDHRTASKKMNAKNKT